MRDIKKLHIGKRELVTSPLFWRNDVIKAWCISDSVGKSQFCAESEYWIGVYDLDAPAYAGKVRFDLSCYGGMCSYTFNKFFDKNDIDCEYDLLIQEKFLEKINQLIDLGILVK